VIAQSDAHAWVEIHYERAGWVRYDPTPADLRARAEPPLSLRDRIVDLASAIELWWFQRVVGFDRSDQIDALKRAWLAWHGRRSEADAPRGAGPGARARAAARSPPANGSSASAAARQSRQPRCGSCAAGVGAAARSIRAMRARC